MQGFRTPSHNGQGLRTFFLVCFQEVGTAYYRSPWGVLITLKKHKGTNGKFQTLFYFQWPILCSPISVQRILHIFVGPGAAKTQERATKKIWSLPLRGSWARLSFYRCHTHPLHPKHFICCICKQVWASPALTLIDRKGGIFSLGNASLLLLRHLMPVFGVFFSWLIFFKIWSWWSSFHHLAVILRTIVAHHYVFWMMTMAVLSLSG